MPAGASVVKAAQTTAAREQVGTPSQRAQKCLARSAGWHSTYFFDPREILPHMQDRVWEAAATARTSCSVNTSGRRCADLEAYLITHHLWVGAGAILRGLPYTYPSPPGTLPRLAQIVAWFVPACTTQCYTVLVTPTDAAIAANTAFTVTAWGRGH